MPRKQRFFVEGVANHIIQRGTNRTAVFFEDADYRHYLNLLNTAAIDCNVKIHAYVLMTNHVHLLATPKTKNGISLMMQQLGRYYVPYINYKYARTGTLWEGRFKCSLVDSEHYVLACMRYIEMNPVRANMVKSPSEYAWSSYGINALGHFGHLISFHPSYLGLSHSEVGIRKAYRNLFSSTLENQLLDNIRRCTQTGTPLGSSRFIEEIERHLKMKTGQNRRGNPGKGEDERLVFKGY